MSQHIFTKIAGVFKYPAAKPIMKAMKPGDAYNYAFEPSNPYDPNAIALYAEVEQAGAAPIQEKCGYIPRVIGAQLKGLALKITKGDTVDEGIIEPLNSLAMNAQQIPA